MFFGKTLISYLVLTIYISKTQI